MFTFFRIVCTSALIALTACDAAGLPANFDDGVWTFSPDRVWTAPEGGVSAPTDALDDADYAPSDAEVPWTATVTEHKKVLVLAEVSSGASPILGTLGNPVGERFH